MDIAATLRRFFTEALATGNMAVIDEFVSADYRNHDMPAPAPGGEGLKQVIHMFRAGFSDITAEVIDVVVQGDKAATRGVFKGTHTGTFNGIPATGKRVEVPWMDFWRVSNGKFVENWVRFDMLAMLTQLGVVPPPPPG